MKVLLPQHVVPREGRVQKEADGPAEAEGKPVVVTPHPSDAAMVVPLQCLLPDERPTSTFIIAMPCANHEPTCESSSDRSVTRLGAGSTFPEEIHGTRFRRVRHTS